MEGLFREFAPDWTITEAPFPHPLRGGDAEVRHRQARPAHSAGDRRRQRPLQEGSFRAFAGKTVRALAVPGCSDRPRSFFDQTEARAKADGAGGLAWLVVQEDGTFKGPIAKFLTEEMAAALLARHRADVGHAVFLMADADVGRICKVMGG